MSRQSDQDKLKARYGPFGYGMAIVINQQLLDGQWSHASTEALFKRCLQVGKIKESRMHERDKDFGLMHQFMVPELMLMQLRTRRMNVVLPPGVKYPDGKTIRPRSVHNVPTGKPLDLKRAEDPLSFSRTGLWVRTYDLVAAEADLVDEMYKRRRSNARADIVTIASTLLVLNRNPVDTKAIDVWPDIVEEIERAL